MSEVLVLIDHVEGAVRKPTYELLTIAKRLGEPSAVYIGPADQASDVTEKVKKYGAEKVYVVDDSADQGLPGGPEGRGAAAARREGRVERRRRRDPDPLHHRGQGDRAAAWRSS